MFSQLNILVSTHKRKRTNIRASPVVLLETASLFCAYIYICYRCLTVTGRIGGGEESLQPLCSRSAPVCCAALKCIYERQKIEMSSKTAEPGVVYKSEWTYGKDTGHFPKAAVSWKRGGEQRLLLPEHTRASVSARQRAQTPQHA